MALRECIITHFNNFTLKDNHLDTYEVYIKAEFEQSGQQG